MAERAGLLQPEQRKAEGELVLPRGWLYRRWSKTCACAQVAAREILYGSKNFSALRVIKRWSRFPRETVKSPSWEIFRTSTSVEQPDLT